MSRSQLPSHFVLATLLSVFLMLLLLVAGCRDTHDSVATTDNHTATTTAARSTLPQMAQVVEVSSIDIGSLTVSWLPTTDDSTPHSKLVYGVHVSTQQGFHPDGSTLKTSVTGDVSAKIVGLQAGATYYVIVTATDEDKNTSWSNALEGKTIAVAAKRTNAVVHEVSATQMQQAASRGSVAFQSATQPLKAGEFIVNSENGGYLRKVTHTAAAKSGSSTAQTEQASLNEVFSDLAFATTVKLTDVPVQTSANKIAARSASANTAAEVTWQDTGLTLSSPQPANNVAAARTTVNAGTQTDVGAYTTMTAPAYSYTQPNQPFTLKIPIEVNKNKSDGTVIRVCKMELSNFSHPSNLLDSLPKPSATQTLTSKTGELTLNWATTERHVDTEGRPYIATVKAYVDEANCNGDEWWSGWEEIITMKIPIYVTQGTPNDQQTDKLVTFKGDFQVDDKVSYNIQPELHIGATLSGASLQSADLKVVSDLSFTNKLTITADAEAHIDQTVEVLDTKRFIKVFAAGGVPIVVSGKFRIKARLEGNVSGKARLDKLLDLRFPNTMFGLEYRDGTWQVVKNFSPNYTFHLTGEADANADITLTLIPDLEISFYDAASGRMLVEPYLYADTELHGQFKYLDDNGNWLVDPPDYWFTQLNAGAGANMRLYAGLHIFDYNIASYPKDVTLDEVDKFKQVTIFNKTPFYSLPEMKASLRADVPNTGLTDSRALFIKGEAKNYTVTVLGYPFNLNPFSQWTQPRVITDRQGAKLQAFTINDTPVDGVNYANYQLNYTMPGKYEIRLGGYSNAGSYLRQIAPLEINLTDDDNDGMVDQWEQRYGVFAAGADDDGDGVTNLDEFKAGTFPNQPIPDADGDGMPYEWEIAHGLNPNDPSDAAKDNDSDGISNLNEYKNGTDPNDNLTGGGSNFDVTKCSTSFATTFKPYEVTNADGSKTTISTFTPSGALSGNVLLEGGTLDLQGKTLAINGDLIQSGGTLNINNGTLIVTGNYRLQTPDGNGGCIASGGVLYMVNEADKVQVNGSFVMDSVSHGYSWYGWLNYLSAGTLEVKGDFTQQSSSSDSNTVYNFYAQGSHKVILSGTGTQKVSFEDGASGASRFANLEIKNTKPYAISFTAKELPAIGSLIYSGSTLYLQDISFRHDLVLPTSLYLKTSTGNNTQLLGGTLNINGKLLTLNSSLIHSGGTLNVNSGKVAISGDYRIQTPDGNGGYTASGGVLYMVNEADKVTVNGSFVMDSHYSHGGTMRSLLTAGTLEVKGNFTQQSTGNEGYPYYATYNFYAEGGHKVVLSGTKLQKVQFEDNGTSRFAQLWSTNKVGIKFVSPITVAVLFEHNRLPFTLADAANSVFVDYDGDGVKDNLDPYPQDKNHAYPDTDGDGIDDNLDLDDDNDGVPDAKDAFPLDKNESVDTDTDGVGNNTDTDDDNDGVPDTTDAFPLDKNESLDTDKDGIGNNTDTDDDNDGMPDAWETTYGLNPLDAADANTDTDTDGLSNLDEFKYGTNPTQADTDTDGASDKAELDTQRNPIVNEGAVMQILDGMF